MFIVIRDKDGHVLTAETGAECRLVRLTTDKRGRDVFEVAWSPMSLQPFPCADYTFEVVDEREQIVS